jgi:hypothetical protein
VSEDAKLRRTTDVIRQSVRPSVKGIVKAELPAGMFKPRFDDDTGYAPPRANHEQPKTWEVLARLVWIFAIAIGSCEGNG